MTPSPSNNRHTSPGATPVPPAVPREVNGTSVDGVSPSSRELHRFLERKRYQELGYELPMNTGEAAVYVGYHKKTVERMAREGEIPAHPVSGVKRKTWKFYPSELDAWLRAKVSFIRHPCSPNGKVTIQ